MPRKPPAFRRLPDGTLVPNEEATAVHNALQERSVERRNYAIQVYFDDIKAGLTTKGRYSRVRDQIVERFKCSLSEGERAIRAARLYLAKRFDDELPMQRAETVEQLQRIADEQERENPQAAVAALRTKAQIVGLFAPQKVEVTHGTTPQLAEQLDLLINAFNDAERAALDIVLIGIERVKAAGLVLPAGESEEDIQDAEIIEPEPGESGAN